MSVFDINEFSKILIKRESKYRYHYATVIVDTPAYQRFDPVAVRINVKKTPIPFKEGANIDF